jgi:hypothetical protein
MRLSEIVQACAKHEHHLKELAFDAVYLSKNGGEAERKRAFDYVNGIEDAAIYRHHLIRYYLGEVARIEEKKARCP